MVNTIRVRLLNVFIVITMLSVTAVVVITALAVNGKKFYTKKQASYEHPCIVFKVDNQGCQSKIEMRTRIAAGVK